MQALRTDRNLSAGLLYYIAEPMAGWRVRPADVP